MIDAWWLLIACPLSALGGMYYTGIRWQRAWRQREQQTLEKKQGPNPHGRIPLVVDGVREMPWSARDIREQRPNERR